MHITTTFFFFNATATTEIYTLSLHDALPIFPADAVREPARDQRHWHRQDDEDGIHHARRRLVQPEDRKSTRLNSSHGYISYAVFCLKKKKKLPKEYNYKS